MRARSFDIELLTESLAVVQLEEQLAMKMEIQRWREQQIELKWRSSRKATPNRGMLTKNDVESLLYGPAS